MDFEDLFDNEVEEFDAGNGYISPASSDSEEEKFILNDDESDSGNDVVPELVHSEDDVSDDEVRSFVKMAKNQYEAKDNERNDGPRNAVVGMQLVVGMEWKTHKEYRQFMKDLAIDQKFTYHQIKNDKQRLKLRCKDFECRWSVFCSLSSKHTFKLMTFVPTHTYEADETNKYDQAKTPWVVDKLEEYVRAHPNLSPKDLMVMPGDEVLPPSIERKARRPRKQRIRGDDEERATSKRKCIKCGVEAEGENVEPIVDVQQQQEDTQVHNVDDIPKATRGGRRGGRRGGSQNVNVDQPPNETQVDNVQQNVYNEILRGGSAGRKGGRGGGSQNVNVDQPPNETQVDNVQQNVVLRGGGRGGSAGRRGGRGGRGRATSRGVG
ncbi:hypothetical protein IFM89_012772 [Coptis chinensis]|uniref:Transposase MuDR plant domain-containing protein n=1 Tax=Coptis chinensis TaxID=261450 RepID=A0A835LLZ6_9MAGN|nr:hypothetical protein IFM89_012772 [Coptis chinensis]